MSWYNPFSWFRRRPLPPTNPPFRRGSAPPQAPLTEAELRHARAMGAAIPYPSSARPAPPPVPPSERRVGMSPSFGAPYGSNLNTPRREADSVRRDSHDDNSMAFMAGMMLNSGSHHSSSASFHAQADVSDRVTSGGGGVFGGGGAEASYSSSDSGSSGGDSGGGGGGD